MRVQVPPRILAYERGISNCEGETLIFLAVFTKIGRKNATNGVLFMNPDSAATGAINRKIGVPGLGRPNNKPLSVSMAPVVCRPAATTNNAPRVTIVSLEKPSRAFFTGTTPVKTKINSANNITISALIRSCNKPRSSPSKTINVTISSKDIDGTVF